jgi:membrane protein required for colicin V production
VNILDIILLIPILFGAYKGFTRGLIIEIASIVGLVAGIYCGIYFSDYAARLIQEYTDLQGTILQFWSFIATFLVVILGVHLLGKTLEKVANLAALKLVNKLMGAGFGMLKMALILSVLIVIVESIDQRISFIPEKPKNNSMLYKPAAEMVSSLIPQLEKTDWHYENWEELTKY